MRLILQVGLWASLVVLLGYAWMDDPVDGAILTAIVCGMTLLVTL